MLHNETTLSNNAYADTCSLLVMLKAQNEKPNYFLQHEDVPILISYQLTIQFFFFETPLLGGTFDIQEARLPFFKASKTLIEKNFSALYSTTKNERL